MPIDAAHGSYSINIIAEWPKGSVSTSAEIAFTPRRPEADERRGAWFTTSNPNKLGADPPKPQCKATSVAHQAWHKYLDASYKVVHAGFPVKIAHILFIRLSAAYCSTT